MTFTASTLTTTRASSTYAQYDTETEAARHESYSYLFRHDYERIRPPRLTPHVLLRLVVGLVRTLFFFFGSPRVTLSGCEILSTNFEILWSPLRQATLARDAEVLQAGIV